MNKLLAMTLVFSSIFNSSIFVYAESKPLQPIETILLSQTLTLLPKEISKIDFPDTVKSRGGTVGILVKTDRKISLLEIGQNSERIRVVFDSKEKAKFQAFIYTNQNRTLTAKITNQNYLSQMENQDTHNQIIFIADLALGKTESIKAVGFLCNKKITLLRVVWLDDFPK
jgi:hypothetical protein